MRRRHPEPTCRRGGPDSGSHLLDYVFQYIIRLKILFIIPFFCQPFDKSSGQAKETNPPAGGQESLGLFLHP